MRHLSEVQAAAGGRAVANGDAPAPAAAPTSAPSSKGPSRSSSSGGLAVLPSNIPKMGGVKAPKAGGVSALPVQPACKQIEF